MSIWRDRAREHIARLTKDLPADATLAERKKVLRDQGWTGGWAEKVWRQEVRAYLETHGLPPRRLADPDGKQKPGKVARRLADGDIVFPFREQA